MNLTKFVFPIFISALVVVGSTKAGLIVSYAGAPGDQFSTLQNTNVETFDSFNSSGNNGNVYNNISWQNVGTINQVDVRPADQYGGSYDGGSTNSNYAVQSTGPEANETANTTLTLSKPSAYFGLWWSAGDPANVLDFYSGGVKGTLVAQFVTSDLGVLPNAYKGNPTSEFKGFDASEYFAFLNFYANPGTTWDTIVFSNLADSGFESDNWTSRVEAWGKDPGENGPPPGIIVGEINGDNLTAVPEPGNATAMLLFAVAGGLGITGVALRRKKQAEK